MEGSKQPEDLKAVLNTFVKKVTVNEKTINLELKIEIATKEYFGHNLEKHCSYSRIACSALEDHQDLY